MTPEQKLQLLDWVARAIGVWFIFTGAMALNAWRRVMLAPHTAVQEGPIQQLRAWTVLAVGNLTSLSGIALLFLSSLAPFLFLANCALQGAYFAWARRAQPPMDEAGQKARSASLNTFFLYLACTLFVLGCRSVGLLR